MKNTFTLEIHGTPVPKGRPRFTRSGIAYTPKATKSYEDDMRVLAKQQMCGLEPFSGPLTVELVACLPYPQSWPKWKAKRVTEGEIKHTTKPDADNLAKMIDGLNGVVWVDDAQITELRVCKQYSSRPRLCISVTHDEQALHSKTRLQPRDVLI